MALASLWANWYRESSTKRRALRPFQVPPMEITSSCSSTPASVIKRAQSRRSRSCKRKTASGKQPATTLNRTSKMRRQVTKNTERCPWVDLGKPDYVAYHDLEWGVPVHDDKGIFEFLTLEAAQA